VSSVFGDTVYQSVVQGLAQPAGWVGLSWLGWVGSKFSAIWWVGSGRGSQLAGCKKIKLFTQCFISFRIISVVCGDIIQC